MTSMFVFGVFLALLFGGGMLVLVLGYLNMERKREEENAGRAQDVHAAQAADAVPRFFASLEPGRQAAEQGIPDAGMISQLESYLKNEEALVSRFVKEPSIDNLYRQASISPVVH